MEVCDIFEKRHELEQLCRRQKASFYLDKNGIVIHCTDVNQYNIVLALIHKIGRFDIKTKKDFTCKFRGDIIIRNEVQSQCK